MNNFPLIGTIFLSLLASPLSVGGDLSSKEYVQKGRLAVVAFQNSYFAVMAKDDKLAEKLFLLGYNSGKEFLAAYRDKKVNPEDAKELPIIFGWVAQGPSDDFILGRLYQAMEDDGQKTIVEKTKNDTSPNANKEAAEYELRRSNAALLVKPE